MKSKKWVGLFFALIPLSIALVTCINYIIDPYDLYDTNLIKNKTSLNNQIRLVKIAKLRRLNLASIAVGTSRTDIGYNVSNGYFLKPSYNLGLSGASMYEARSVINFAVTKRGVKQILLVADWGAFNSPKMKEVAEFDEYFSQNLYSYLPSLSMLKDSLLTIKRTLISHAPNGQRTAEFMQDKANYFGGHYKDTKQLESEYSKENSALNIYKDTRKSSFADFKEILKICHENGVKLDIIFGPSHIRLWEAFAYYHDYEIWLKWKKDVVLANEAVAKELGKKPFRIMDFSVYHALTSEVFPLDPAAKMRYHWEASHYKSELGDIVLDRLAGKKGEFDNFGVELNSTNINVHLQNLRDDRAKFIDTKAYQKEVWGVD